MIWHDHDPSQHHQLKKMLCKIREIEKEYHLLPQIDAKKKDPVSREYT